MAARSSACLSASLSLEGDLERGLGEGFLLPPAPGGVPLASSAAGLSIPPAASRPEAVATALPLLWLAFAALPPLSGFPPLPTTVKPSSAIGDCGSSVPSLGIAANGVGPVLGHAMLRAACRPRSLLRGDARKGDATQKAKLGGPRRKCEQYLCISETTRSRLAHVETSYCCSTAPLPCAPCLPHSCYFYRRMHQHARVAHTRS